MSARQGALASYPSKRGSSRTLRSTSAYELEFPMAVRLLEANPYVEETLNQVAIQRGPVVYCLESADLPEGVRVLDVRIPADMELQPRIDLQLLGERVVVLEGQAERIPRGAWSGQLYREL